MMKPEGMDMDVKDLFQALHDDFSKCYKEMIIMSHFGEFSQDLVNSLSEGLEKIMRRGEATKTMIKRMFSIMIEGLQNIRIHGICNHLGEKIGHVIVINNEGQYFASFGNLVNVKDKKNLSEQLNRLRELNPPEIKELYLNTLSNGKMSDKGGAGLGFITIALKAKSEIEYQFIDFDDHVFYFEMRVKLNVY